jgi:adenosylcobinamide-GDP ribazoletransferase
MSAARAALTFLTRLPLAGSPDQADLARGTVYFPLVGTLIGALGAGVYWLATMLWPSSIAIILAVATTVLATGALHEDGLADFADGFGGGWTPEQVLAIMKDSRIGSYGMIALTLVLLAKLAALNALTRIDVVRALIAAHTIARWAPLPLLLHLPYVRAEGGTATPFAGGVPVRRFIIASITTLAVLAATLGLRAIPVVIAGAIVTAALGRYTWRRIGGITGDVLGATAQCVELTTYLVLSAYISIPG